MRRKNIVWQRSWHLSLFIHFDRIAIKIYSSKVIVFKTLDVFYISLLMKTKLKRLIQQKQQQQSQWFRTNYWTFTKLFVSFEWFACGFFFLLSVRVVWGTFFFKYLSFFLLLKLSHLFQVLYTHSLPKFMDGCKFVNSNFSFIFMGFNFFQLISLCRSFSLYNAKVW